MGRIWPEELCHNRHKSFVSWLAVCYVQGRLLTCAGSQDHPYMQQITYAAAGGCCVGMHC